MIIKYLFSTICIVMLLYTSNPKYIYLQDMSKYFSYPLDTIVQVDNEETYKYWIESDTFFLEISDSIFLKKMSYLLDPEYLTENVRRIDPQTFQEILVTEDTYTAKKHGVFEIWKNDIFISREIYKNGSCTSAMFIDNLDD